MVVQEARTWHDLDDLNAVRMRRCVDRSGALAFAMANHEAGFRAPLTGMLGNPLASDGSAFLRALYWGLTLSSEADIRLAFQDLSFDHANEGLACALALALLVQAFVQGEAFSSALTQTIPLLCSRAQAALRQVATANMEQLSGQEAFDLLRVWAKADHPYDAVLNFMTILAALRRGGSFAAQVLWVSGMGGLSGHTAAAVGAIAAMSSEDDLSEWLQPLGDSYVGTGLISGTTLPATLQEFVACIATPATAPPFTVAPDLEPDQALDDGGTRPLPPLSKVASLWAMLMKSDLRQPLNEHVTAVYPRNWAGDSARFELGLEYTGEASLATVAESNWEIFTRGVETYLGPGKHARQPVILTPGAEKCSLKLKLDAGNEPLTVPVLPFAAWYVCGPMANVNDEAFHRALACEQKLFVGEHFAGRSGLAAQWERRVFPANLFEVEPLFQMGQGAVCLYGKFALTEGKSYTLVVSGSPGGVVFVHGHEVIRYLDTHQATYQAEPPYIAHFVSRGADEVLIRLLRANAPVAPLAVYVLDELGHVVDLISEHLPKVGSSTEENSQ